MKHVCIESIHYNVLEVDLRLQILKGAVDGCFALTIMTNSGMEGMSSILDEIPSKVVDTKRNMSVIRLVLSDMDNHYSEPYESGYMPLEDINPFCAYMLGQVDVKTTPSSTSVIRAYASWSSFGGVQAMIFMRYSHSNHSTLHTDIMRNTEFPMDSSIQHDIASTIDLIAGYHYWTILGTLLDQFDVVSMEVVDKSCHREPWNTRLPHSYTIHNGDTTTVQNCLDTCICRITNREAPVVIY